MNHGQYLHFPLQHLIGNYRPAAIGNGAQAGGQIVPWRAAFGKVGQLGGMRLYLAGVIEGGVGVGLFGDPVI